MKAPKPAPPMINNSTGCQRTDKLPCSKTYPPITLVNTINNPIGVKALFTLPPKLISDEMTTLDLLDNANLTHDKGHTKVLFDLPPLKSTTSKNSGIKNP